LKNYLIENSLRIEATVLLSIAEFISTPFALKLNSIKDLKQIQIKNLTKNFKKNVKN
jgi:hypothetical protein